MKIVQRDEDFPFLDCERVPDEVFIRIDERTSEKASQKLRSRRHHHSRRRQHHLKASWPDESTNQKSSARTNNKAFELSPPLSSKAIKFPPGVYCAPLHDPVYRGDPDKCSKKGSDIKYVPQLRRCNAMYPHDFQKVCQSVVGTWQADTSRHRTPHHRHRETRLSVHRLENVSQTSSVTSHSNYPLSSLTSSPKSQRTSLDLPESICATCPRAGTSEFLRNCHP